MSVRGFFDTNSARSRRPQNDTKCTRELASQSLGRTACGEVVAQ
jgi:hypothetical protein